jgi:uncharacterized protein with LGFP repeats
MNHSEEQTYPTSESRGRGNGPDSGSAYVPQALTQAKQKLSESMTAAQDRSRQMIDTTSGYVQRWPFSSVAIAMGVGVIIGLLLAHRGTAMHETARRSWW